MIPVVSFLCCIAAQQLSAVPFPAEVGQEVTVRAVRNADQQPWPQHPIDVELPDGTKRELGVSDQNGELRFVPEVPGQYVFAADIDGIRVLAPHRVVPAQSRWIAALVCVPLGLALLWRNLRSRKPGVTQS